MSHLRSACGPGADGSSTQNPGIYQCWIEQLWFAEIGVTRDYSWVADTALQETPPPHLLPFSIGHPHQVTAWCRPLWSTAAEERHRWFWLRWSSCCSDSSCTADTLHRCTNTAPETNTGMTQIWQKYAHNMTNLLFGFDCIANPQTDCSQACDDNTFCRTYKLLHINNNIGNNILTPTWPLPSLPSTVKHGGGGAMVWGCFAGYTVHT